MLRLGAACVLPWALRAAVVGGGGWGPLVLATGGALTDFLDGPLARRQPPTRYGALLDNVADIALVLAGTGTAAELGMVPWAAPVAIALAFGAYALASTASREASGWHPARSRLGHAAGVLNYALVLLVTGALALPRGPWPPILALASGAVIAVNLAAVGARIIRPAARPRGHETPDCCSTGDSRGCREGGSGVG